MSGNVWVSVIILSTVLAMVVRALSGQRIPAKRLWLLAAIWLAIFLGLVAILSRYPVNGL